MKTKILTIPNPKKISSTLKYWTRGGRHRVYINHDYFRGAPFLACDDEFELDGPILIKEMCADQQDALAEMIDQLFGFLPSTLRELLQAIERYKNKLHEEEEVKRKTVVSNKIVDYLMSIHHSEHLH